MADNDVLLTEATNTSSKGNSAISEIESNCIILESNSKSKSENPQVFTCLPIVC